MPALNVSARQASVAPALRLWFAAGLMFAAILTGGAPVQAQAGKFEQLTIAGPSGRHVFQVEVMRNDAQRAQGLMFRRQMAADHGMLFDFEREAPVAMWMKNTYLPLDMIFIDRRGRIVNIAENTEPLSERTIPSAGPVLGVLEVNAGTARRLRIRAGDMVEHPMFKR
ncbi:MAG: DUF192 domain-containing protein [Alphaproteobacteria bacterium]|nr:DUF192 domain-containing protein [Alphaproteobacteria bacterium]